MIRRALPLAAAGLLALAMAAVAADPPAGRYDGRFDDDGRPVPVILRLKPVRAPGDDAGAIRFEEPWVCGFGLEFSDLRDGVSTYSMKGPGAGACTSLTRGYARIQSGDDGLRLELFRNDHSLRQTAVLQPATRP